MNEQTAIEIVKAAAQMFTALVRPGYKVEEDPGVVLEKCVEAVHQSYLKLRSDDQRSGS